jgi:peroxiredoxin
LQQRYLAWLLLRADAPSEEVLAEAVAQAADPTALLRRLWGTQRIPHRQFVVSYLGRVPTSKPEFFQALEPVMLEAVEDGDITVRGSVFATLKRLRHPELRVLALEQLSDADPAARIIGLQTLRGIASSDDVPIAMRLLNDLEPRVVVAAALVLSKATSQDFGIRSVHALPQFTCIDTNPPPAPDLVAINQGVQRWREWWTRHQAEFPMPLETPVRHTHCAPLVTADFTLQDSDGKPIRLSQFRGKAVLLSFWSPDAPASLDDVTALRTLQQREGDRLAVLGVCIPPADCRAGGHQHSHVHHHDDGSSGAGVELSDIQAQVRQAVARLKINYPMLLDREAAIAPRFSIQELPAYIIINGEGKVCRRVVGFRTEQALTAMVEEMNGGGRAK